MSDYKNVYENKADSYDLLVSKEDYEKNILPAIQEIIDLKDIDVVELGAGTGRLTTMIAPLCRSIKILDSHEEMLKVAEKKLKKMNLTNWQSIVADNRSIPLDEGIADLVIEGWAFGHLVEWNWDTWKEEIDKALHEMGKLLKPGGVAIIIETLGTGFKQPVPPSEKLQTFYNYLEKDLGFFHKFIRTDFQFSSLKEAFHLVSIFWGENRARDIVKSTIVPECTGFWWVKR